MDKTSLNGLLDALRQTPLPGSGDTLGALKTAIHFDADTNTAQITLPIACQSLHDTLRGELQTRARAHVDTDIDVAITTDIPAFGVQRNLKPLPNISNVIAVASGKGGVGKSTTAANLALALAAEGARVGVLDADIYGPSMPRMFGLIGERPSAVDNKRITPLKNHGVSVMSIGFLVDETAPMVWRGPMVTSALNQLLHQTDWPALDVLIVDMPPGTGDIQLTLSQTVPVAGAVIVTTPQDIALSDARKGLEMFRKVSVNVLGVIENMSLYICGHCGTPASLFGEGGGQRLANDAGTQLLGELPLALDIRQAADSGCPTVAQAPDSEFARHYRQIAISVGVALARTRKDYSAAFGHIVVEDT
ncbi:MAG: iron-sulfur cluster carrier protein ApbC [Pseudomonadota bacterium]